MPLFMLLMGAIMLDSGLRGNAQNLFVQFEGDLKGFLNFGAIVVILGVAGFSPTLRPISKGMLLLVFVAYFLKNGKNIVSGIETAASTTGNSTASPGANDKTTSQAATAALTQGDTPSGAGQTGSAGDPLQNVASASGIPNLDQYTADPYLAIGQTVLGGITSGMAQTHAGEGAGTARNNARTAGDVQAIGSIAMLALL